MASSFELVIWYEPMDKIHLFSFPGLGSGQQQSRLLREQPQRGLRRLLWFYLPGIYWNLHLMLQPCFRTFLDCKLERECVLLTRAECDWRWACHLSCSLLLDGCNACSWWSASADPWVREMSLSYARRRNPVHSPRQLGSQDTFSKGFSEGSPASRSSGRRGAESPAASPGGGLDPGTSPCWKPQEGGECEEGVCWLGEVFWRVSELLQLVHGCTSAPAVVEAGVGGGTIIRSSMLAVYEYRTLYMALQSTSGSRRHGCTCLLGNT